MNELELNIEYKDKLAAKKKEYLSKLIGKKAKFEMNLLKKRPQYIFKSTNDLKYINQIIAAIKENEQVHIMSSAFDSPSIIYALNLIEPIKEVICSTWAITDRGLQIFAELGKDIPVYLLLDKTYSYKWVFESGAIAYLENVRMKFTENHSKCILIKTDTKYYTFIGSMNLSNNPRLENIIINENKEIYGFYEKVIKSEFN